VCVLYPIPSEGWKPSTGVYFKIENRRDQETSLIKYTTLLTKTTAHWEYFGVGGGTATRTLPREGRGGIPRIPNSRCVRGRLIKIKLNSFIEDVNVADIVFQVIIIEKPTRKTS